VELEVRKQTVARRLLEYRIAIGGRKTIRTARDCSHKDVSYVDSVPIGELLASDTA
jgi:hypothetical protein